jgi:hypothetical protein
MIRRQFTWENSLSNPTYEKLDRVLMDANGETKFPMVIVHALERIEGLSNHAPILSTTGSPRMQGNHRFNLNLDGYSGRDSTIW